jgi:hypothetical protein
MLGKMADEYYKQLWSLPPSAIDLREFAELVLNKFVEELKNNKQGVAWNSGFDSVIFLDKAVDGHKSLNQIKEEFLGQASNVSNSTVPQGAGIADDRERDS